MFRLSIYTPKLWWLHIQLLSSESISFKMLYLFLVCLATGSLVTAKRGKGKDWVATAQQGRAVNCPTLGASRCLSCASWVDCTQGTPIERNCSLNMACGENEILDPPAFCGGTIQSTPDNSNCFCSNGDNGVFEDPYSIYSYVRCVNGEPEYLDCPPSEAFIDSQKTCVSVPECTDEETVEIPLSCSSKLICVFEYGDYTGYLDECTDSNEIFNEDEPDYCYIPTEGVCSGPGNIADPYKCNIWHQCLNDSDPTTSSCCPEGTTYNDVSDNCENGQCSPSGLCIQEHWEQAECHACGANGELYETDNICTEYYFECYLDGGFLEVRLAICPIGQLFDPVIDQCSSSVSGC